VTVSSLAHRSGRLPMDDLNWERRPYSKAGAYGQSKLANIVFSLELERRLRKAGSRAVSVAAHPGYSATSIFYGGDSKRPSIFRRIWNVLAGLGEALLAQSSEQGALPTLYAAGAADVCGGEYFGPDGFVEFRGYPRRVKTSVAAADPQLGAQLWAASERMTGIRYLS
jgi:NAD(P)-dependent dehydrogenase (short-subunit alcohol dehydrogenase family)